MDSSDIYDVKEPPWANKPPAPKKRRRQHPRVETFDEAVNKNVSGTHLRRSHNRGFRHFRHRLKDPDFSKKFWTITLGSVGAVLLVMVVWDLFFRYPDPDAKYTPNAYHAVVE
jgi:hypothetical protein